MNWLSRRFALESPQQRQQPADQRARDRLTTPKPFAQASIDNRFMGAVAAFGQKLHNNAAVAQTPWEHIAAWARSAKCKDANGYRAEFVQLVKDAKRLATPMIDHA